MISYLTGMLSVVYNSFRKTANGSSSLILLLIVLCLLLCGIRWLASTASTLRGEQAQLKAAAHTAWQHYTWHSQTAFRRQHTYLKRTAKQAQQSGCKSQGAKQSRKTSMLRREGARQSVQIKQLHIMQAKQMQRIETAANWLDSHHLQSSQKLQDLEKAVDEGRKRSVELDARVTDTSKTQALLRSLSEVIKDLRAQLQASLVAQESLRLLTVDHDKLRRMFSNQRIMRAQLQQQGQALDKLRADVQASHEDHDDLSARTASLANIQALMSQSLRTQRHDSGNRPPAVPRSRPHLPAAHEAPHSPAESDSLMPLPLKMPQTERSARRSLSSSSLYPERSIFGGLKHYQSSQDARHDQVEQQRSSCQEQKSPPQELYAQVHPKGDDLQALEDAMASIPPGYLALEALQTLKRAEASQAARQVNANKVSNLSQAASQPLNADKGHQPLEGLHRASPSPPDGYLAPHALNSYKPAEAANPCPIHPSEAAARRPKSDDLGSEPLRFTSRLSNMHASQDLRDASKDGYLGTERSMSLPESAVSSSKEAAARARNPQQVPVAMPSRKAAAFSPFGTDQPSLHSLPSEKSYIAAIHARAPPLAQPRSPFEAAAHQRYAADLFDSSQAHPASSASPPTAPSLSKYLAAMQEQPLRQGLNPGMQSQGLSTLTPPSTYTSPLQALVQPPMPHQSILLHQADPSTSSTQSQQQAPPSLLTPDLPDTPAQPHGITTGRNSKDISKEPRKSLLRRLGRRSHKQLKGVLNPFKADY